MTDSDALLDWFTHSRRPLQLMKEEGDIFAVIDMSSGVVIGSGASAQDALNEAYLTPMTPEAASAGGGFDPYAP